MCCAGDPERLAHQHRTPRHGGLVDGGQSASPVADGGLLFGLGTDHEARIVHQVDNREVERLGQVDEPGDLLRRGGRPTTAVVIRVACQDGHRPAVQPCQATDGRSTEGRSELEEAVLVDHRVDDRPHPVDLPAVPGHQVRQVGIGAVRIIRARSPLCQLVHR